MYSRMSLFSVLLIPLLISCGRIQTVSTNSLEADQAMDQLISGAASSPAAADASKRDIRAVIEQLADSGKIQVPTGTHSLASSTSTLDSAITIIENILDLIASGQVNNLYTLAKELVSSLSGGGNLQQDLTLVSQILTAILPYLATLQPALIPVVQSLIAIIPVVQAIIKIF